MGRLIGVWIACLPFLVNLQAQEYLHQVIVLNEGWSDWQTGEVMQPATMGTYDPGLQSYSVVDTLEGAGFVSDALIDNQMIYVAADGALLQYDANTFQLLQSAEVIGIRKMVLHNGLIYITRGDTDDQGLSLQMDAYFQWYDAVTLELVGELTVAEYGPQFAAEGITSSGDRIYLAVNNGFEWGNEVGFIGAYDTVTDEYLEWDLGENGTNPYHLFEVGGSVISVNNRDYSSTSLSALNLEEESIETVEVSEANAGCLAAISVDSELRYQITGEAVVRQTNAEDLANSTTWITDCPSYYGMAIDPISGDVFGSVTDYSTFGLIELRSEEGELLSQFDCGVSPGVICMDVRSLQSNSVVDIIVDSEVHTMLEDALVATDLIGVLNGEGPFTVFAPTDDAHMALMAALGITLEELLAYPGLTDVLLYHVVEAQALSTDLIDGQQITTLLGADVQVTITGDGVFINQAQVIVADLVADNGVVHVIDAVLLPEEDEELPETVVDIIVESEVHTLLELAVGAAGLVDALSGEGPFTVFAPTDDAIVALTVALGITADDLLALPNLGEILQYHVVAAEAYSDDLIDGQTLTTLEGSDVTVTIGDAGVMINEAMVIIADLEADNGVVHVIDAVLIPTATNVLETATLDFTVYPNPASAGVLNVQGSWNANASIQIWNAAGQLVQTDQTLQNQHVISTEGLSSGLYTLRVLSGTSSGQKMFLVD